MDLVVAVGPTGPDAWPVHPRWVRLLAAQCAGAGVAFAFLGWGDWAPVAGTPVPEHPERVVVADGEVVAFERVGAERAGRLLDVREPALPSGLRGRRLTTGFRAGSVAWQPPALQPRHGWLRHGGPHLERLRRRSPRHGRLRDPRRGPGVRDQGGAVTPPLTSSTGSVAPNVQRPSA